MVDNYSLEQKLFEDAILRNVRDVMRLKTEKEYEEYVSLLEKEFCRFNGSEHTIAVNSGTTALTLALAAAGIHPGDEVILPAHTYIASALAVSHNGGTPVFADIQADTLTIDPVDVAKKVTKKTKALMVVHIHGNVADMDSLVKIAKKYKLSLVEDCSHAHGASYRGTQAGNFGIGCFSCQSSKVFAGMGNAGLITSHDERVYQRLKEMIDVKNDPFSHLSNRTPCRMDVMQAAVLRAKLPFLNTLIEKRKQNARAYAAALPESVSRQKTTPHAHHVFRDLVIMVKDREVLSAALRKQNILAKIRYRHPLHRIQYYAALGYRQGSLPITERIYEEMLWLPVGPVLDRAVIARISSIVAEHHRVSSRSEKNES